MVLQTLYNSSIIVDDDFILIAGWCHILAFVKTIQELQTTVAFSITAG